MHTPDILRKAGDITISAEQGKLGLGWFLSQTSPHLHINRMHKQMPKCSHCLYFQNLYKCDENLHNFFGIITPGSTERKEILVAHTGKQLCYTVFPLDSSVQRFTSLFKPRSRIRRDCILNDHPSYLDWWMGKTFNSIRQDCIQQHSRKSFGPLKNQYTFLFFRSSVVLNCFL